MLARNAISLLLLLCCESLAAMTDPVRQGYQAFKEQKWEAAYEYWVPEAKAGNARAQFYLSMLFRDGLGVAQDEDTALTLLTLSAEGGFSPAQFDLGNHFQFGEWVERDMQMAIRWWRRAAENGYARAQYNLGLVYYLGKGVEKDLKQAVRWYRRAAIRGSEPARETLKRLGLELKPRDLDGEGMEGLRYLANSDGLQVTISEQARGYRDDAREMTNLFTALEQPSAAGREQEPGNQKPLGGDATDEDWDDPRQLSSLLSDRRDKGLDLSLVTEDDQQEIRRVLSETEAVQAVVSHRQGGGGEISVSPLSGFRNLQWIRSQPQDAYTLQLSSNSLRENAQRLAAAIETDWVVAIFPFESFGKQWYGVVAGSFEDIAAARAAREKLPPESLAERPWIRSFGDVVRSISHNEL